MPNKKKKKEIIFSEDVEFIYNRFISTLPQIIIRKLSPAIVENWKESVKKLIEIDEYPKDIILLVIDYFRSHPFWTKQLRALPKLRRNDRNGLQWMARFLDILGFKTMNDLNDKSKIQSYYKKMNKKNPFLDNLGEMPPLKGISCYVQLEKMTEEEQMIYQNSGDMNDLQTNTKKMEK